MRQDRNAIHEDNICLKWEWLRMRKKLLGSFGELAGELQYFRKIFLDEFSEVVEKCEKLDGDCG